MEGFNHLVNEAGTWVGVAVIIFMALLVWKAFPKLGAELDSYGAKIQAEIDEAKRLREEAEKLLADAKMKSDSASSNAEQILAQAKIEAQKIGEQATKDLELELVRKTKLAEEKIERAKLAASANLKNRAVDEAIKAAEDIIKKELGDTKTSGKLVENSLRIISSNLA